MAPLSRARRRLFIAIAVSLPLVLLLAVELGLRLLWPVSPLSAFVEASREADFRDARKVTIFEADPWLMWRLAPNLHDVLWDFTRVTTNSRGLRMNRPVGPRAAEGLRILCVGDSVTFGYRVPLVFAGEEYDRAEMAYPELLEGHLRRANPNRVIEVIPLAVPGYTSSQGLRWLTRDIAFYQPDLVTLCFGWNDVSAKGLADAQALPKAGADQALRTLVAHSQLATRVVRWGRQRRAPAQGPVARVGSSEYCANFLAMAQLARAQGAQVMIVAPVYRDATTDAGEAIRMTFYREELTRAARSEHIPMLVVPELTEQGSPNNAHLFGELIHPNAAGHRLLAERLLTFMADYALLPPQFNLIISP